MKLTTNKVQAIQEVPYGVYLWKMPDGSFVADDDGHYLMISGTKETKDRRTLLAQFVKSEFGITEGAPCFFPGHRPVTDEEFEEQRMRMQFGLTPDKFDISAIKEDRDNARARERGTY